MSDFKELYEVIFEIISDEVLQDFVKLDGEALSKRLSFYDEDIMEALRHLKDTWVEEGYEDGKADGIDEGYDEGHSQGYDEGYAKGKEEGYEEGFEVGGGGLDGG